MCVRKLLALASLAAIVLVGCTGLDDDDGSGDSASYSVSGQVSGLDEGQLVTLSMTWGEGSVITESITGSGEPAIDFVFGHKLVDGEDYVVSIPEQQQPSEQYCVLDNGEGRIDGRDVADVAVTCYGERLATIQWEPSRHVSINAPGSGYYLYYSAESGFEPGDAGVEQVKVSYDADDEVTPTQAEVGPLSPQEWYFRVQAFSELGGESAVGPEWTLMP